MTRRTKLALVTLFAGLLSLVPVSAVSADAPCTGYAQEHCEEMATANDSVVFRITEVAVPPHVLSSSGIGQEHFEATVGMAGTGVTFTPVNALPHVDSGMAPEHFAQYLSQ